MPEGDDYIEWSLSRKPVEAGTGGHIALETPNMSRTLAAIEARAAFRDYNRRHEAHVGINHKWQGNFFDPDGTRTEFMEPYTADGMPSPMSHAPYF
jgi:lactoylglutathione lyase